MKSVYWRATRAYSLPASIVPVLLGAALAFEGYGGHARAFSLWVFVLTLAGAILAHFGGNVLNDYFDFKLGVDTKPEHGSGVLTSGLLSMRQMGLFGILLMAGGGVCGLLLMPRNPAAVGWLALIGLACAVLYPALLKRFALGDLLIIASFGIGLTVGAWAVQSQRWDWPTAGSIALISLPVALLVDGILHVNNLVNREDDAAARVRTLATFLSPDAGRRLLAVLLFGPVALTVLFVLLRLLPLWSLLSLAALPPLVRCFKTLNVPGTAQAHLLFGLPYALALALPPIFLPG